MEPLAGAVELLFCLEEYAPEHRIERLVPNGRVTLVIELDGRPRYIFDHESRKPLQEFRGSWLSGVHSEYLLIGETTSESRLAAVQFVPGMARPLLHSNLSGLVDRVVSADEVLGPSVLELRATLTELDDPGEILSHLEEWLAARYEPSLEPPGVIRRVMERLTAEPGEVTSLAELVEADGSVSYKHFVALFKKHVGPSPKRMQRILRFAQVFARIQGEQQVNWVELSLELGYSDQAHFVRDFAAFSGYRPQRFFEDGHERLNFFPDELD